MTISIGKYNFEGSYQFKLFNPKNVQGIYAILIPGSTPGKYLLIYIGQSSDFSNRGIDNTHHAYSCWIKQAKTEQNLFVAFLNLTGYSEQQRKNIEEELIAEFQPTCNMVGKN